MSGRLVLLRHAQSYGNLERRLDTVPPGAGLTPLGHEQARAFARGHPRRPALLAYSVTARAAQTAAVISAELGVPAREVVGIHEVQVGELENRNDEEALAEFHAVYRRWHHGELEVSLPGGETGAQVLSRYLPVLTELRLCYLDNPDFTGDVVVISHGAAIRLAAAALAGVDGRFVLDQHLGNAQAVVLAPVTGGRWSCVQWGELSPPFPARPEVTAVRDAVRSDPDPVG
ncbi:histidine phosphatase family protein [Mycobacterium sp. SM1]|uniref:histidine phosphatase family protein n=1 Tax=Mycobacterium sp. SM1 TaxID=2816243 RepID=UPI001BCD92D1|nr:histidine phosphatase family protein [Mycobacterium sp. SM1]MBS4728016.1 histidine phosphatase family protein [Mycobacterium sp. SM1]